MGDFFAKLFDMSFEEFITPTSVKVAYIIAALSALLLLIGFANAGGGALVAGLIVAPTIFVLRGSVRPHRAGVDARALQHC